MIKTLKAWLQAKTARFIVIAEVDSKRTAVHYAKTEADAREWMACYFAADAVKVYHALCGVPLSFTFGR
ncbi:hypothetical protein Axy21_001 [Achromobacter phage vB_AxyP_19-32_Axy21]|uniref:Uncharacterized protein n=1 Tax=Achromobacter phage vB_AxyP_19-32_Axy21 TaxID=2591045 RepID=A0A514CVT8_9CAUD|nr:hypothetical protein Axy21_001 [Achromobacter phage vB_AxyP_19-32_Axy21]